MQGNLRLIGQLSQVRQRQIDGILHQSIDLQPVVAEVIVRQGFPLVAGWQLAIGPEERGNVIGPILRPGGVAVQQQALEGIDDRIADPLDEPGEKPR